jgi:hypothetical protein
MLSIPSPLVPVLQDMIEQYAILDGDIALVAGWGWTESGLDPWAYRPEKHYRWLYPPENKPRPWGAEWYGQKASFGLFQIMGAVGREWGLKGWLTQLCDPRVNADLAARILLKNKNAVGSWANALAAFNGGLGGYRKPIPQRYADKVYENAELFR